MICRSRSALTTFRRKNDNFFFSHSKSFSFKPPHVHAHTTHSTYSAPSMVTIAMVAFATSTSLFLHNDVGCDVGDDDSSVLFSSHSSPPPDSDELQRFKTSLVHHSTELQRYKTEWDWTFSGQKEKEIETFSWPPPLLEESSLPSLEIDLKYCYRRKHLNQKETNITNSSSYCQDLQFRIASFLLLSSQQKVKSRGLEMLRDLAELHSHADAICSYAMLLYSGLPDTAIEIPSPESAYSWHLVAATVHSHPQSQYEVAVAMYMGDGIDEDEAGAREYFRLGAMQGHSAAAYMLGDCMLDGVGGKRDRADALYWLVKAAEMGHRGARSRGK